MDVEVDEVDEVVVLEVVEEAGAADEEDFKIMVHQRKLSRLEP